MFSLIITIVSIALVVALVAATMYHGGNTLTQGSLKAQAAGYIAGAQQISGAATLYQANHGVDVAFLNNSLDTLITNNYLTGIPRMLDGSQVTITVANGETRYVGAILQAKNVCAAINQAVGETEAQAELTATTRLNNMQLPNDKVMGCAEVMAGAYLFFFKY